MLCLGLMVALSANTLLAAVNTSATCDGMCCCRIDTRHGPAEIIVIDAGCCRAAGATPCHMSEANFPDSPLALNQASTESPLDPLHLLATRTNRTSGMNIHSRSKLRIASGPDRHFFPRYLQNCRLIC
jgi:hypothetical protein